jgi:plasmid stabilization system protein ParE
MSLPLIFDSGVRDEIDDAYFWYEKERLGLGEAFLSSLDEALRRLQASPNAYPVLYRGVRRCLLHRFPYCIYYRDFSDRLEVLAVQHSRRHPNAWRSRV